jgi:hypothetical protein
MSAFKKKQGFVMVNPLQETVFSPSRRRSDKIQYSQTSDHEQFGLQTDFPNTKRLG